SMQRLSEVMQLRRHQPGRNTRIVFHERSSPRLISSLEDRNAKRLVTWLLRASRENQLPRFYRFLEANEMALQHRFVLLRPIRIRIEARHEAKPIYEMSRFACFRGRPAPHF